MTDVASLTASIRLAGAQAAISEVDAFAAAAATAEKAVISLTDAQRANAQLELATTAATRELTRAEQDLSKALERRIAESADVARINADTMARFAAAQAAAATATTGLTAATASQRAASVGSRAEAEAFALVNARSQVVLKGLTAANNEAVLGINAVGKGFTITGGVAREFGVIISEIMRGDFTRLTASMVTMANRLGLLPQLFAAAASGTGLLVVAVAALSAVWLKAENDNAAVAKALAATGNAANMTVSDVNNLALSLSGFGKTVGHTKEAIVDLIQSSQLVGTNLQNATQLVVDQSELTGKSIESVAAAMRKIADDDKPLNAIREYDRQFNLLTEDQYKNIRAMDEAGNKAGELAEFFADAAAKTNDRVDDVNSHLRGLAAMWVTVKDAASGAWAAMDRLAGGGTALDDLNATKKQVEDLQRALDMPKLGLKGSLPVDNPIGALLGFRRDVTEADAAQIQRQLAAAQAKLSQQTKDFYGDQQAQATRADAQAMAELQKHEDDQIATIISGNDRVGMLRRKLAEARQFKTDIQSQDANDPRIGQLSDAIAQLSREYEKALHPRVALTEAEKEARKLEREQLANYAGLNKWLDGLTAANNAQGESVQKLSPLQVELAKKLQEVTDGTIKLSKAERDEEIQKIKSAQTAEAARAAKEIDIKQTKEYGTILEAAAKAQESRNTKYADELDAITKGSQALKQENALRAINKEYIDRQAQADKQAADAKAAGTFSQAAYNKLIADLGVDWAKAQAAAQDYFKQLKAAEGNWQNGFKTAMADLNEQAANVAKNVHDITIQAFDGATQSIVNFINTGKGGFKALAVSVLTSIETMMVKMALLKAISHFFPGFADDGSAGISSGAMKLADAGGVVLSAAGAISAAAVQLAAAGKANGGAGGAGSGSGGILGWLGSLFGGGSSAGNIAESEAAQIPGFASGTDFAPGGVATVGEAGPERVYLPKGSRVVPNGGGDSGASITFQSTFLISNNGSVQQSGADHATKHTLLKELDDHIKGRITEAIGHAQRPGGALWKLQNGY